MMNRRNLLKTAGAAAILPLGETMLAQSPASEITPETVYELRVYHLNEGKQDLILERFRTRERALFERHGMHPVAYWVPTEDPLVGRTLMYIVRHKSHEAASESWAKFSADPEWVALKAESEKNGAFVKQHDITFMKLTDFSPAL
jgi:hypothetical protein